MFLMKKIIMSILFIVFIMGCAKNGEFITYHDEKHDFYIAQPYSCQTSNDIVQGEGTDDAIKAFDCTYSSYDGFVDFVIKSKSIEYWVQTDLAYLTFDRVKTDHPKAVEKNLNGKPTLEYTFEYYKEESKYKDTIIPGQDMINQYIYVQGENDIFLLVFATPKSQYNNNLAFINMVKNTFTIGAKKIIEEQVEKQKKETEKNVIDHTDITLKNCDALTLTDNESNIYKLIGIGTQCFMAENLRIGTMISGDKTPQNSKLIEKWCYDNNLDLCENEGAFYNWDEAMNASKEKGAKGICPDGWHIPTDEEFIELEINLGMTQETAENLGSRELDDAGIITLNGTSGFDMKWPGLRDNTRGSNLKWRNSFSALWSSTEETYKAYRRNFFMGFNDKPDQIGRDSYDKQMGFGVRCLKD